LSSLGSFGLSLWVTPSISFNSKEYPVSLEANLIFIPSFPIAFAFWSAVIFTKALFFFASRIFTL